MTRKRKLQGIAGKIGSGLLGLRVFFLFVIILAGAPLSTSAEDTEPMRRVADIFKPLSAPAEMAQHAALVVLVICGGIFLVVTGLLFFIVIKYRHRKGDDDREPAQIYGSTNIELAWTVLPILITVVLVLVTSRTIGEIQDAQLPKDALEIRLIGHQWWWEIHYPGLGIITANEIHVPVSSRDGDKKPTRIFLESADVIHSFWVPQLAGKTDLVPNRRNETWIEPYATGTFFGNCAEYCGSQHANMLLRVVVQNQEDFDRWVQTQKAPVSVVASVARGHDLFFSTACVNCHKVDGTPAEGVFGPDLTKLMTRQTLGAGVAPLTTENLRSWVQDPQILKPGCLMPDMKLQADEVDAIVAYLETMK